MGKALGLDFNLICHFVIMYKSQKIRHPGMDCRDQDYRDVCVDRIQCGECVCHPWQLVSGSPCRNDGR